MHRLDCKGPTHYKQKVWTDILSLRNETNTHTHTGGWTDTTKHISPLHPSDYPKGSKTPEELLKKVVFSSTTSEVECHRHDKPCSHFLRVFQEFAHC